MKTILLMIPFSIISFIIGLLGRNIEIQFKKETHTDEVIFKDKRIIRRKESCSYKYKKKR